MHALAITRKFLDDKLSFIHKTRRESLFFAVKALIVGGRLSLTSLGRSARGAVAPRYNIKRIDRLLGNPRLTQETTNIFASICTLLLQGKIEPWILIDWTKLDDNFYSLSAAVPVDGRAIPIYWEVHPKKNLANRKVQHAFLETLKRLLPNDTKPVIVTDSGFQGPWFKAVTRLEWNYVGRLSGLVYLDLPEDGWRRLPELYPCAVERNQDLGICRVTKKSKSFRRVILGKRFVRNPARGPAKRRRNDRGRSNEQTKKRSQEPWVIATSLDKLDTDKAVGIYAQRMQIEESYRDVKNHRFGWSFSHARTKDPDRFTILLLIATIANIALTVMGQAAESIKKHLEYQANTIKHRRVLSLFYLGKCIVMRGDTSWCTFIHFRDGFLTIKSKIKSLGADNTDLFVGIP